jgi:hypothetical protein
LRAALYRASGFVLCIIADECRVHGICDLANDAIAARAGGAASLGAW